MKESERSSSRRLVSSRTASFESLTDEGAFEDGYAGAPKKRDSSWDSKWKQQVASNGTPPFIRRIGGSPGRLDNRKWEEKGGGGSSSSARSSPHLTRRRLFKSPSVERKFLRTPPPLPPGPPIPESLREASSSASSSSEATPPLPPSSSSRSESVPQSPRTVRRKLVIRAAKTPSPVPKEWGSSSCDSRGETLDTISSSKETKSRTQESSSENIRLKDEWREFEGRQKIVREDKQSPPHSPKHTGTYTAMPVMAVSDEEGSSSMSRTPSMNRSSPEKKKFLDSMLNHSSEKTESDSSNQYKSIGEMRSEQRCESKYEASSSGSWSTQTESKTFSSTKSYQEQSSTITLHEQSASSSQMKSELTKSENKTQSNRYNNSLMGNKNQETHQQDVEKPVPSAPPKSQSENEQGSFEERRWENSRQLSSKDQNNNDIPDTIVRPNQRQRSPKKSSSPSENVLTSLEKLVKETESMINKHLDTEEDKIVRPSEVVPPPLPPPRSASINKVPLPDKADSAHHFVPPPPPPPPPVSSKKFKPPLATPSRLVREPSPSSTISEEILNTAKELQQQHFDIKTDELDKAEKILDKKKQAQEERTLKKRLLEQKIKKEEMFRLKNEKERNCPPPEEDPDPLDSIIFQGIPPRPIRHTPTPQLNNDPYAPPRDYGRPTMVKTPVPFNLQQNRSPTKEVCRESKMEGSSLRDEIHNQRSSSTQRMKALKDVERRDRERIMKLRKSMIDEDRSDSVTHEESFPPPPIFLEEKKPSDPRFVVLRDPSMTVEDVVVVDNNSPTQDEEYLDAEELELEALRSAGQKERELLEEMERRKRDIEEEIARERKRIEELHKIENEKRLKFHSMKKTQRNYQQPPKAVQQYEEMVARKMNMDRSSSTPTPPPPPLPSHHEDPKHTGPYESSEFDEETDTEGYGDEDFSLGIDIPYADFSSNNVTPTPTSGEMEDLEQKSSPSPIPPSPVNLRSLLRSRSSLPYSSHDEDGSRKVHFSEIDQVKVLSMESLLSTINSEASEPIYSNRPHHPSPQIETAFHQSRNYYQVRPPCRNQTV